MGDRTFDRYDKGFLNERENFYHKPLVNINWYAKWTQKVSQYTTVYYSGGQGGGTGTLGSMKYNYHAGIPSPSRFVNWDKTIENNTVSDTAFGILRNSRNDQNMVGVLSKFKILFTDNFKAQVGVDWRKAKIDHYREVRDLLGGQFFYFDGNEFESGSDYNKKLGDKIAYNFTNTVDWMGYFVQAEYSTKQLTAYGTFGHSFTTYTYLNHFKKGTDGDELLLTTDNLQGYQIKGGLSYRPFKGFSVFGNFGYISKAPIFDNTISDNLGKFVEDSDNEIFNAFEVGATFQNLSQSIDIKANYYYTSWENRAFNYETKDADGSDIKMFLSGINQLHKGFEVEGSYKPVRFLSVGLMASIGNWEYTNNVSGQFKFYNETSTSDTIYNIYADGLKVGDAPQTQIGAMLTLTPIKGMRIQFDFRYYDEFYADWNPFKRSDEADSDQVWKSPSYFISDLHFSYKIPLKGKFDITVFTHVFNLFDELYIQDAVDDSDYNGYYGDDNQYSHTVNSAEVYLGLPRSFNAGIRFSF